MTCQHLTAPRCGLRSRRPQVRILSGAPIKSGLFRSCPPLLAPTVTPVWVHLSPAFSASLQNIGRQYGRQREAA